MNPRLRKAFGFSIPTLLINARRLRATLDDPQLGTSIAAQLPPSFQREFAAQIDLVERSVRRQITARNTTHGFTATCRTARARLQRLTSSARKTAQLAYPGSPVVLHGGFQVGNHARRGIADILSRANVLAAACEARAADLEPYGWTAGAGRDLRAAIDALHAAYLEQRTAFANKEGCTAQQNAAANGLYRLCRTLQVVADRVYPSAVDAGDSSNTYPRARFLLGEFPPRQPSARQAPAEPAADPVTPPVPAVETTFTPVPELVAATTKLDLLENVTPRPRVRRFFVPFLTSLRRQLRRRPEHVLSERN